MSINKKRGSIALARSLCYQINGAADDSDDIDGGGYGSVDVAEILSAEVERLREALAQPEQEPVAWNVIDPTGNILATEKNAIRGWARVNGYKPTVEGLLGLHELGWRVLPTSPPATKPEQEPSEWRDMIVVSLVREGIDKHRARELADHFAAQRPWQGLTDEDWAAIGDMPDTFDQGVAWAQARLKERNNG
jgi:hypothetical protein